MEEFGCSESAIKYTTRTYSSTAAHEKPRSGRPRMLSRHQQKLVLRKARATPKIEYPELAKAAQVVSLEGTPSKLPSKSTLYREIKRNGITNLRCKERPSAEGIDTGTGSPDQPSSQISAQYKKVQGTRKSGVSSATTKK
jgi:transposase